MHLTRPKSSKGRSRPVLDSKDGIRRTAASPGSPVISRPDRDLRSRSQPAMGQTGQLSRDEVLLLPQRTPAAPPQSLNKYKVLPSIESRRSEVSPGGCLDTNMSKLTLSEHAEPQDVPSSEGDTRVDGPLRIRSTHLDPGPVRTKEAGPCGRLLLAIRAPCGRRFQQHFETTDTLLMVRASAEVRYGAAYRGASIETMDLPRRRFTDLDMTLAQCGILNRSVLCISLNNASKADHD
ncbi:UBX domain-containing protein 10 [Echeneis naucrates]|uniref:UBX domain-containing protein n=1 Tax=Echeneis naucrates TaxID=173247 RepID=A0A665UPI1_ECHNA|nr:UBX domain-containing protein 10 [Echeneis naucrates]